MYLALVTHDPQTNTLEATWIEPIKNADGEVQELRRVKCRNYSPEQKADFEADLGEAAARYVTMAGW